MSGIPIIERVAEDLGPSFTWETKPDFDITGYTITMVITFDTGEIRPTRTATIVDGFNFFFDFLVGDLVEGEHAIDVKFLPPDLKQFTLDVRTAFVLRVRPRGIRGL